MVNLLDVREGREALGERERRGRRALEPERERLEAAVDQVRRRRGERAAEPLDRGLADLAHQIVPAHGRVAFSPDGMHVMLMGLRGRLVDGARQPMTLRFEHAGPVTASFQVRARITGGGMGAMPGMTR